MPQTNTQLYRAPYLAPFQPRFAASLLGPLILVTPPAKNVLPLDAEETRLHCSIEDDKQDALVERYIWAAARYAEQNIPGGRQLLTTTFMAPVEDWWPGILRLPRPPCQSIVSIQYFDTGGVLQTLDPSITQTFFPWRAPAQIELFPYKSWPALQPMRRYPVQITFTCGYGGPNDIPSTIQEAMRLLVCFQNEHRGELPAQIPPAIQAFLDCEDWGSYG
jgi:uncharacterized phiE125 gp8 family phage protein